jgi:hypothetical protein
MTYTEFITKFPAFESLDQSLVEQMIEQIGLEYNGFIGFPENVQPQALGLAVAHYLQLENNVGGVSARGDVKRLKSRNDEVEFGSGNNSNISPNDWSLTSYGARLQRLFTNYYCGGWAV